MCVGSAITGDSTITGIPAKNCPETDNKLDLLSYDWVHPRNLLFGTPEYVTEKIQEMKDKLNLQNLLVWSSFPGMQHEATMASIELFTQQVMPHFSEDEQADHLEGVA